MTTSAVSAMRDKVRADFVDKYGCDPADIVAYVCVDGRITKFFLRGGREIEVDAGLTPRERKHDGQL